METFIAVVIALLGGGTAGSLVTGLLNRRKNTAEAEYTEADADLKVVEAASKIIALYGRALEDLQAKVDMLEATVAELQTAQVEKDLEISMLRAQLQGR